METLQNIPPQISDEITHVLDRMKSIDPSQEEYTTLVNHIKILSEAQAKKPARMIDRDVLLTVGANLTGILLVLYFERFNVVTSRAFSMILRTK